MLRSLLLCTLMLSPLMLNAELASPDGQWDGTIIDPTESAWYYGELKGEPHTYMLYLDDALDTHFNIYVPKTGDTVRTHAAIIVKQATRGVDEVARLPAESASWKSFLDVPTGKRYQRGASYNTKLEPGIYIIEVHSPDNQGQYVLRFGDSGSLAAYGYFGKLSRLASVNRLQERSPFALLLSPYTYVPVLLLIALAYVFWRKWYHA